MNNLIQHSHKVISSQYLMHGLVFCRHTDKPTVLSAIDNVKHPGGELTDYVSVAKIIYDVFNPINSDRISDQNILIVVCDGAPGHLDQEWAVASHAIQADGVAVFFLCVDPCTEHLSKCVASPPKQVSHTINVIFQSGNT